MFKQRCQDKREVLPDRPGDADWQFTSAPAIRNIVATGADALAFGTHMTPSLNLSSDEALVLFEWLGERSAGVKLYDENDRPISAEEFVLNRILAQLEKAFAEPFDPAYRELLASAR